MSRDEYIKQLCARAISADDDDFVLTIEELQIAIREHIEKVRAMAATALLKAPGSPPTNLPQA